MFFTRWVSLLETAVADPDRPISRIDLLTAEERHRLLVEYNNTTHPVPDTSLPVKAPSCLSYGRFARFGRFRIDTPD
jgi:hypothetical protein